MKSKPKLSDWAKRRMRNRIVLEDKDGREYRELAASANDLVQDRCDIRRGMCFPTKGDATRLTRL